MSLQAITIAQPWPRLFLLDENPKRIENRHWMPPRSLIGGWLALHGGRLPKTPKDFRDCRAAMDWVNGRVWGGEEDPTDWLSDEDVTGLCVPGIYAVARLAEVVTSSEDPWFVGPFGWILEDFTAITPVPCKGSKNLWPVEGDLLATVRQRWRAARTQALPQVDEVQADMPETSPPLEAAQHAADGPPWEDAAAPSDISVTPAQVDLGAHLRIPGLFCPGVAVAELPRTPELGRLYGLPVGGDWVTVRLDGDSYSWCSRKTSGMGRGGRAQLLAWLESLRAGVAA